MYSSSAYHFFLSRTKSSQQMELLSSFTCFAGYCWGRYVLFPEPRFGYVAWLILGRGLIVLTIPSVIIVGLSLNYV